MQTLERTDSENIDFKYLVKLLDQDLKVRDGDEHAFYDQFNIIDMIKNSVVCYEDNLPIACGALKKYDDVTVEIKRMYVKNECRGKGIGAIILKELEAWASELNYKAVLLETGKKQPEAIRLYQKSGYELIPNFGQYKNASNSVCMKKYFT